MNIISKKNKVNILIIICFVPIFLDRSGIFNTTSFAARGVPLSILIIFLFPYAILMCRSATSLKILIVLSLCMLIPTLIFGILKSHYFNLTLLASYATGLLAGFTNYCLIKSIDSDVTLERVMLSGFYTIGIVTLFWVPYQLSNVLNFSRANGSVHDFFVIYQVWSYFPTVLAIAFCTSFLSSGLITWILRTFIFFGIVFTAAREPILFIFVFGIIYVLAQGRVKYFLLFILLSVLLIALLFMVINTFPEIALAVKLSEMMLGAKGLDGGRFEVLEQFQFSEINPLLGTGFSMSRHFGTPHNQYIEFYYRAGAFGLAITAIILFAWVRSYGYCSKVIWSIFGALLIVTSVLNTPVRVPYTGTIFWMMFFFFVESRRGRLNSHHSEWIYLKQSNRKRTSEKD